MSEEHYIKLRRNGQFGGGLIVLLGIIAMFWQQNAGYFLASYFAFWVLNYVVIHHYVGKYLLSEKTGKIVSKTLIDPI